MQHLQKTRGGVCFPFWKTLHGHGDENSHFIQVLSFHILAHSLARRKTQLFCFHAIPHSLGKNTRGWGYTYFGTTTLPPNSPLSRSLHQKSRERGLNQKPVSRITPHEGNVRRQSWRTGWMEKWRQLREGARASGWRSRSASPRKERTWRFATAPTKREPKK